MSRTPIPTRTPLTLRRASDEFQDKFSWQRGPDPLGELALTLTLALALTLTLALALTLTLTLSESSS